MTSKWPSVELGSVAEFRNGLNYSQAARQGGGLPILGVKDFQSWSFVNFDGLEELDPAVVDCGDTTLRKGDILFVRSNGNRELIGRSLLVRETPTRRTTYSGFTIRVRFTNSSCDPYFFAYVLRGPLIRKVLSIQGGGTNISNLNQNILSRLRIPHPTIEVQRRIASILGAYDDLIEVNQRRIAVLEEMALRLFEEWFVHFRFPGHEGCTMVSTPTGMLPADWMHTTLGQVAQNFDRLRKPLSKPERQKMRGQYPYFGAAKIFDYIDRYLFDGLHLLIAEDGSVITENGFPVLQLVNGRFWVNNHAHVLTGQNNVSTEFLYLALQRYPVQGHITGAAQPKITQANLNRIPLVVGSPSIMKQFNVAASNLLGLKLSLENSNTQLAASRDLLLPRLVSGDLSVTGAELELEAVA